MEKTGFYRQVMRNMLHLNNGNGTFSEIGRLTGVSSTDWSWAPLMADFDNDGWKDIYITNGYMRDYTNMDFLKYWGNYIIKKAIDKEQPKLLDLVKAMPSTQLHNYIYQNNQNLTFNNKVENWGLDQKVLSNGAVYADLDNDGDLEIISNNINDPAFIYKNLSREIKGDSYLQIRLKGKKGNSLALGSKVYVYTEGKTQFMEQMPPRGYQSSVSEVLHFGLGKNTIVDSIRIVWSGGKSTLIKKVQVNQKMLISEEESKTKNYHTNMPKSIFQSVNPPFQFTHQVGEWNDFKRQPLLPHSFSSCGLVMAVADVNGDGREDIYLGGGKGYAGQLLFQNKNRVFEKVNIPDFEKDSNATDSDALWLDVDNDGDLDLYVVSGGYADYKTDSPDLRDRLYLNEGNGVFKKSILSLPNINGSKSCIRACDFDKDGDLDIFLGGRVIPGRYPEILESFLLENNGNGIFSNIATEKAPEICHSGMVTDAIWTDVNGDDYQDLVVVGEFMPVKVFINQKGRLVDETKNYFNQEYTGLWNKIMAVDFDKDGDLDLIVGNIGLNTQMKANENEPLSLIYKDFDGNGSVDMFLNFYIQGKNYPNVTRDELLSQIIATRKKFPSYESYSEAQMSDIFSPQQLQDAKTLKANHLETTYFENKRGKFIARPLPMEAQFSPVYAMTVLDYDKDGNLDMILAGNDSGLKLRLGRVDANYCQLFKGDGKGNFIYIPQLFSGFNARGDIKNIQWLDTPKGKLLLLGVNQTGLQIFVTSP